jgi:DNA-binding response OmpR family regulator
MAKLKVLIVDDDPIFCRFVAEVLEIEQIKSDWTTDGLKGYEMSLDGDYDIFIVDVRMPLILGTELAEEIRTDKPVAKIILISAFPDDALKRSSERLHVSLLSKPFSAPQLMQAVKKLLANNHKLMDAT